MEVKRERRGDNEMLVNKIIYFWVHRKLFGLCLSHIKWTEANIIVLLLAKDRAMKLVVHKLVSIE